MRHIAPINFTRGCAKSDCFRHEPNEREGVLVDAANMADYSYHAKLARPKTVWGEKVDFGREPIWFLGFA